MSEKSERKKIDDIYEIYRLLRMTYSNLIHLIDNKSKEYNLTSQQLVTLRLIHEKGSASNTDLSEEMHYSKGTISGIVRRLELRGYIRRVTSETDRRCELLYLTDEGERFVTEVRNDIRLHMEELYKDLSQEDLDRAIGSLKYIEYNISKHVNK